MKGLEVGEVLGFTIFQDVVCKLTLAVLGEVAAQQRAVIVHLDYREGFQNFLVVVVLDSVFGDRVFYSSREREWCDLGSTGKLTTQSIDHTSGVAVPHNYKVSVCVHPPKQSAVCK